MAFTVRRVDYFYATLRGEPQEAYQLLSALADVGIDLVAFASVPIGPLHTHLTLFPQDSEKLAAEAPKVGLAIDGPHPALLVQGDDELGALAEVHRVLRDAKANVFASSGVADGRGSFGYVVYVRPEDYGRATAALGL